MSLGQIYGTGYEVILVAFSGIVTAQIIKFLLHLIIKRSMDLRLFTAELLTLLRTLTACSSSAQTTAMLKR